MPTTPVYALPYQALTDPPDGAALGEDLALAVEAELVRVDAAAAVAVNRQTYIANGTWTKPAGAKTVRVQCWGGGGAGGGCAATGAGTASCGSGGQAGGYAETWFAAGSLAATETVVVGAGGTGASALPGNDGAASTFSSAGNLVSAGGGTGGGIAGASASYGISSVIPGAQTNTGQITVRGNPGFFGLRAGPDSTGGGGNGGSSDLGGAGWGIQNTTGGAAEANSGSGGGGAGNNASQSARTGGAGGSGRVVVTCWG